MASTYLTRTASGTDGSNSQRKNTVSMWLKRASISDACFIEGQGNNANATQAYFDSNANLTINHVSGDSSLNFQIVTNRMFRDTSAWYHIVITIETSQSTAADRVKIYVNGVRETSFASASYPGQNATTQLLARLNLNIIGRRQSGGTGLYFDGSMSHIHVTDGTAYDASYFGETDATTGEWKIKTSPSVTYGNNGFFILKDGDSVTDQSGNSNDFTVAGGTLRKTEDCPSNVFACGNVLGSGSVSFSNGNNAVHEGGTSFKTAIATLGASSGKYYAEVKAPSIGSVTYGLYTGFVNLDKTNLPNLTNNVGDTADSAGISSGGGYIYYNGQQFTGATTATTANDVVNLAMDLDNGFLYWGINGTYLNSGNPASGASGTGGMPIANITAGGTYTFAVSVRSSATINFNFGNGYFGTTAVSSAGTNASGIGIFEYDVPTGYTALTTKGLNL
jgi:hypothetical protein